MAGFAFFVAFVLSLVSGASLLAALFTGLVWGAIVWVLTFLLSLVLGAGFLGVAGIAALFGRLRKDKPQA